MSNTQNEPTAMDLAKEACAQLVEEVIEDSSNAIMTTAVLLYEVSYLNDDSELEYKVSYSVLTESSLATSVGVITLGSEVFMNAVTDEEE